MPSSVFIPSDRNLFLWFTSKFRNKNPISMMEKLIMTFRQNKRLNANSSKNNKCKWKSQRTFLSSAKPPQRSFVFLQLESFRIP